MGDYLVEEYNQRMKAIQEKEAADLGGALQLYLSATTSITERGILDRVDAAAALAAAMSQRDHEYHNGRNTTQEPKELPNAETVRHNGALLFADTLKLMQSGAPPQEREDDAGED
jgi:hypothetical protein